MIFPEAVKTLTNPEIPYWIDSPYGGQGWDTADQAVGDVVSCPYPAQTSSCIDKSRYSILGTSGLERAIPIRIMICTADGLSGTRSCSLYRSSIESATSEFGVPALPCMKTVDTCFPPDEPEEQRLNYYLQSKALQRLNKAGSHEGRFSALMNENFGVCCDLET